MNFYLKIVAMSFLSFFNFSIHAQDLKNAANYFKNGDFAGAKKVYSSVLSHDTNNFQALVYLGYIELLSNQLGQAERYLLSARNLKPKVKAINHLLAEVYNRQMKWDKASLHYLEMRRKGMGIKTEYLSTISPYKLPVDFDQASIKFIITDPLPIIEVIINNEFKGFFIIDTGGGEVILDYEYAKKVDTKFFGIEKGSQFGGGKKATLSHGYISSIKLAGLTVENIPVLTLDLSKLDIGGYKIDGIIGTVFLYQFLSSIDYKNGQLILRNKLNYTSDEVFKNSNSCHILPFLMADDHFMLAKGTVNNSDSLLFFVDTGLAGNAFTCPASTLKKAGLSYLKEHKSKALGGGGYFVNYPMNIDKLCLGEVCAVGLHGVYGAFPDNLETSFGFNIHGLISHEFFKNHMLTIDFNEMNFIISD